MNDLELKAREWVNNTSTYLSVNNGFIAGTTSDAAKEYWYKQFEKQII